MATEYPQPALAPKQNYDEALIVRIARIPKTLQHYYFGYTHFAVLFNVVLRLSQICI